MLAYCLKSRAHHGGKGVAELTTAEVWVGAPHIWADQDSEKKEYGHSAGFLLFSFLSILGPQPMGWCHSHLGESFLLVKTSLNTQSWTGPGMGPLGNFKSSQVGNEGEPSQPITPNI